jgi:hypothetical protein
VVKTELFFHLLVSLLANSSWLDGGRQGAQLTAQPSRRRVSWVALRLVDRGDLANEILAEKIMALAKAGERDPERLCDGVLREFRRPPPQA